MADGFARVTNGRPPGVFAMRYGPGAENAFPGIATTYSDSVPVLFLPLAQSRDQSQVYPTFMSEPDLRLGHQAGGGSPLAGICPQR